jgi:hypothetical protein
MIKRNHNKWIPYGRLSRRKQRDAFIRLRQKIRDEAAVYGGEFTSHHVLDEPDRSPIFNQWADFYFLGSDGLTIWNATIVTAVLEFWDNCEGIANERAWEMLTPEEQSAEAEIKFEPIWHKGKRMYRMVPKPEIVYDKFHGLTYHDYQDKLTEEIIKNEPPTVFESFSADRSYRYGIGLNVVIHVEAKNYPAASRGVSKTRQQHENHLEASFGVWTRGAINRATIEEAIHRFRTIGETDWRAEKPVPRNELPYESANKVGLLGSAQTNPLE